MNKNKNINELLRSFFGADEAAKAADDIRRGDELLAKHAAPLPRPAVLADIRTQMLLAHHRRQKTHRMHVMYSSVAMAASVAIIGGLAVMFYTGHGSGDLLPTFRNSTEIAKATQDISGFTTELNSIEDSAVAIQTVDFDAEPAVYQDRIVALEDSLWKG